MYRKIAVIGTLIFFIFLSTDFYYCSMYFKCILVIIINTKVSVAFKFSVYINSDIINRLDNYL